MRLAIVAAVLLLAGCASTPAPSGTPHLVEAPGQPAPPQARLYADCITQAAERNSYDREANVLRFRCTGEPAQRFFDGLGAWSARIGSEYDSADATWRFSTTIRENPSLTDFCRRTIHAQYDCTVVLNVGEFLSE